MKRFTKLLVAVAIVAMAVPAFAAVENIKVGGDIDVSGISRKNFYGSEWTQDYFQSQTRVYVQAQLTDNVEAMVRLINERDWNVMTDHGLDLDVAYIKVCDLGVPGLGLTVGKQEIQFGEGLVVGSGYFAGLPMYPGTLTAKDLGKRKAFDAIRVDYKGTAPVDATVFMSKIVETYTSSHDMHLYGLNLGFGISDTARLEGYYVRAQNMSDIDVCLATVGIRATGNFSGVELKGEYARQLGEDPGTRDYEGWALLLGGEYNFDAAVSGNIHANLNLFSGEDGSSDKNTGWVAPFSANNASRFGAINYAMIANGPGSAFLQNTQVINIGAGIQPVEKVGLAIDWFNLKLMDDTYTGGEDALGNEIDASVTYNYTEDLAFGLQYGIMMTGDALGWDNDPWQLIASAKLAF